ncbi:response regulator [Echinicola vietnamensis]|uniref:Sensory/regulatory protein RpfC n=1 Tax=Echinicola vietnamensis (strain DSM 17526 / LMG 23754 / KMM 6221) TaxID=926556 RepID=L0G0Y3_ECHVK|nr:response regulator [Echinicola vietnamensis]AGA79864.1 PAS domain S-box [Echinicola vietnamensis DSM 17526]
MMQHSTGCQAALLYLAEDKHVEMVLSHGIHEEPLETISASLHTYISDATAGTYEISVGILNEGFTETKYRLIANIKGENVMPIGYVVLIFKASISLTSAIKEALSIITNALFHELTQYEVNKDVELPRQSLREIYHKTNEVARVGGWELDCETNTIFWTDITREIHEVESDFVPTLKSALTFYDIDDSKALITKAVSKARRENKPYDLELRLKTAKGNIIWIRTIGEPEFKNSVCVRIFGTIQDTTKAKEAEENVIQSKKLLENVLNTSTEVSIIATDAKGIVRLFSKGAERMLGYAAEEVVDKCTPDIFHDKEEIQQSVHRLKEEYGQEIDPLRAFIYESILKGSDSKEWTYIRKDKRRITVKLTMSPMRDDNGEINGYLGVATDITDEKKATQNLLIERARLHSFVKHVPAAVAMLDNELKFIAYSDKWIEMYGLEKEDLIGKSHYEIFTNISEEWQEVHRRGLGGEVIKCEEDVWRPEGWSHDQYVRWEIRPWYRSKEKIGGILMLTEDITEAYFQKNDLQQSMRHAEQANRAKSEFLANMSHEIRTPLNGIIGFSDLVLKTELNDRQEQYLSIVNQSANSLLNIINDILDFSKIEAGKLDLDIERYDLYELVEQASDIITYVIHQKGLEMLLNISPNIPRFAWIDSVRLKQVLVNLLGNASKFTDKGEIELKLTPLSNSNKNGEMDIRFSVRDTGIGIKSEKQDKIFEAFSQEDVSTTKKYGGTGLGLTISNRLLQLMGSKLQLTSTPNRGSTFYFDLRIKCEDGQAIPLEGEPNLHKILIVDDNANNRMIIERMLALKGIQTVQAKNGYEAIQRLVDGEEYDVILMDFQMPYLNGIDTARKIRANFKEQPIIFLHSSSEDKTISLASKELSIPHRLIKPIKMQDMYDALLKIKHNNRKGKEPKEKRLYAPPLLTEKSSILFVEDNAINMLLGKTVIHNISPKTTVLEASNGKQALELLKVNLPDMIFMDVQMPEMNGYEATKIIRKEYKNKNLLIFALTAGNLKGEKEKCMEAGMDDFIAKPFVEEDLIRLLEKWSKSIDKHKNAPSIPSENLNPFNIRKLQLVMDFKDLEDPIFKQLINISKKELTKTKDSLELLPAIDNPDLSKIAHKLYSSATSLCMEKLASLASKLENASLSMEKHSLISSLTDEILLEITERLADLNLYSGD